MSEVVSTLLRGVRRLDKRLTRRPDRRRILVDARTPVNFTMIAPVFRAMQADPRVEFYFTATEEPARMAEIYHEALAADGSRSHTGRIRLIHPRRAAVIRFDAYIASDFMWAPLVRDTAFQVDHVEITEIDAALGKRLVKMDYHRLIFRPRDSYDQRLLDSSLVIDPEPTEVRWIHDVFGNCVTVLRFASMPRTMTERGSLPL